MTGWTPETRSTEAKCVAPYYYNDTKITGFRGSHWLSGGCTQDYGSVTLMPTTGELKVAPGERASRFRHASEVMSPAFYSVDLDDYHLKVELTGTARAGMMRITFPASSPRHLLIEPNIHPGQGFIEVHPETRETQQHVRELLNTQFAAGPDGLPGNGDSGQMSAWYVLSAIGFYPACPGTPAYSIGSPLFSRVAIHLTNGKTFTIAAQGNSAENIYVRSIHLDGHAHPGWTFSHNDILRGATLTLDMVARPATQEKE